MRILVANRGEIACRIIRTVKKLGHTAVALEKYGNEQSLPAKLANELITFSAEHENLSETYLSISNIISLALANKIDAIHPGYGFLSESQEFSEACNKNNILFIGPSAKTLELLGDKVKAKKFASELGIPTVPGFEFNLNLESDTDNKKLIEKVNTIGLPVIIKAAFGGGGRGMRIVKSEKDIISSCESASLEAKRAFGNGAIFIEKYIYPAQHIEIQIIGDSHKNCIHLFERDCSLQRRHQKVIEIAPSINISDKTLNNLYQDSIKLGLNSNLTNAATIEFLVNQNDNQYYFIESNPRLQVEHTITEEITGIDIVELQIKSVLGEALPNQKSIKKSGHAIQLRVCAENPEDNFTPSTGRIEKLEFPSLRLEIGYEKLNEITTDYDSLTAKLIVKGDSWNEVLSKAINSVLESKIEGISTNLGFLLFLLKLDLVKEYKPYTNLIDEVFSKDFLNQERFNEIKNVIKHEVIKFLNSNSNTDSKIFNNNIKPATLNAPKFFILIPQLKHFEIIDIDSSSKLREGSNFNLMSQGYHVFVSKDFTDFEEEASESIESNEVFAPLPCQILNIYVSEKEAVTTGQKLLSYESMKTEYSLLAHKTGTISILNVKNGDKLNRGDLLLKIE